MVHRNRQRTATLVLTSSSSSPLLRANIFSSTSLDLSHLAPHGTQTRRIFTLLIHNSDVRGMMNSPMLSVHTSDPVCLVFCIVCHLEMPKAVCEISTCRLLSRYHSPCLTPPSLTRITLTFDNSWCCFTLKSGRLVRAAADESWGNVDC